MAISLLLSEAEGVIHEPRHDLESLFYVLIYCATMLKGPHGSWRVEDDFRSHISVPMREWFGLDGMESSYARMGRLKLGHMADFERAIIRRMDPYFSPLFSGLRILRDNAFPVQENTYVNSQLGHDGTIKIFNDILAQLPSKHTRREADPNKRGVKRKR